MAGERRVAGGRAARCGRPGAGARGPDGGSRGTGNLSARNRSRSFFLPAWPRFQAARGTERTPEVNNISGSAAGAIAATVTRAMSRACRAGG